MTFRAEVLKTQRARKMLEEFFPALPDGYTVSTLDTRPDDSAHQFHRPDFRRDAMRSWRE